MAFDRAAYMRDYMRSYRATGRDKTRGNSDPARLPFVGVDGEGGTHPAAASGYHSYWLLSVGAKSLTPRVGDVRLRTTDIFRFLTDLPKDAIYVIYFGDYDVTKILEDVPTPKLTKLLDRGSRVRKFGGFWPVDWGEWQFDYLPRKEFKVRRQNGTKVKDGRTVATYDPWFVLNDVGSFFQSRFVEALDKWQVGTETEYSEIVRQKERRDEFRFEDMESIRHYNVLENKLLAELMEKFRAACIQTGYVPNKWQGPGQLAEAMFRAHGVPESKNVPLLQDRESGLLSFARKCFYGGRPENMAVGPVNREAFQFDINSAYPAAMRKVPCLIHGKWVHEEYEDGIGFDALPSGSDYAMVSGRFRADLSTLPTVDGNRKRPPLWYGLPVRNGAGGIAYPSSGQGWYWDFEVRSAIHQYMVVKERWAYFRECDCQPLGFVSDVYRERKRMGKDGAGMVLKLSLNSLYGKTAQSIGSPKYANPILASFITADCRTQIQDFIHSSPECQSGWCGSDILAVATDSLTTTNPRPDIEISEEMGGWSREVHPRGLFLIQPGLYFGSSGKHAKTRGVPRSAIEDFESEFRNAFRRMSDSREIHAGTVRVPQRMFCGIRLAIHRRNTKLLGQWIEFVDENGVSGKAITFDWRTKRAPFPILEPTEDRSWIVTFPYEGSEDIATVPYSKNIGALEENGFQRAIQDEQPEGVRQFESAELVGELS